MIAHHENHAATNDQTDYPMSPARRRSYENRGRTQVVFNGPPAWVFAQRQSATKQDSKFTGQTRRTTVTAVAQAMQVGS